MTKNSGKKKKSAKKRKQPWSPSMRRAYGKGRFLALNRVHTRLLKEYEDASKRGKGKEAATVHWVMMQLGNMFPQHRKYWISKEMSWARRRKKRQNGRY